MSTNARNGPVSAVLVTACVALALCCLALKLLHPFEFAGQTLPGWLSDAVLPRVRRLVSGWSLQAMLFYPFGLLAILLLERRFPAVPTQRTLSTGLVHDVLWVLIEAVVELFFVGWYVGLLSAGYARYLSFLTLTVAGSFPMAVRLGIGVVVMDLLRWIQHWLHHRVKWLWPFHAVHHAQRELNLFSDYRNHFMEQFVRRAVLVLPMLMLGLDTPHLVWWVLLLSWHARLYHANIRSDFGPLRYVFVTPQSHRVHHSRHPEHFDRNYGAMLSVWDYLFGTQYRRYDVYPETGVQDEDFPVETTDSVSGVLATTIREMLYPFRRLFRTRPIDRPSAVSLTSRRDGR